MTVIGIDGNETDLMMMRSGCFGLELGLGFWLGTVGLRNERFLIGVARCDHS